MTFQEANKNSKSLFSRNNLTKRSTEQRLLNYFSEAEVKDILISCKAIKSWTDGNIVVLYFKEDETYTIVSSAIYMALIEP